MQADIKQVKKQFQKSFETYDNNALVQKIMADKLLVELAKIEKNFENVLELGTGTAQLAQKFRQNFKYQTFIGNDLVEKSQNYLKKYIPDAKFLCGNALKIKPNKKQDLIISNAMFQWFNNLDKAFEIFKQILEKDGILAFTTFSPNNFYQIKELTGVSLKYKTKEEITDLLKNKGFELLFIEEFQKDLVFNNPLEVLAHIKHTGVNSINSNTWSIKEVKDFCEKYREKYNPITLTYSPIVVIAKLSE